MSITLTLTELAVIVFVAVGLASTDASAISRLAVTYTSKKLGISPNEIYQMNEATDGSEPDADQEDEQTDQ